MSDDKGYVKPPKKETVAVDNGYVKPPTMTAAPTDDYVAPPKAKVMASQTTYVTPPRVAPQNQGPRSNPAPAKSATQQSHSGYFATPHVGWRFYLTGYLVLMVLTFVPSSLTNFRQALAFGRIGAELSHVVSLAVLIAYILLSNYTFSWLADYQRAKGGIFAWFFTPFGSARAGIASSSFMNFQKGTVTRGMFGGYQMQARTDVGKHVWYFLIITIILELLKFVITIPVAFISLFLHGSTIRSYRALANQEQ